MDYGHWKALFSNNHVSVALDMTQLVTVEVNHQLSQSRMGGCEVDFHLGIFTRSHWSQPAGKKFKYYFWGNTRRFISQSCDCIDISIIPAVKQTMILVTIYGNGAVGVEVFELLWRVWLNIVVVKKIAGTLLISHGVRNTKLDLCKVNYWTLFKHSMRRYSSYLLLLSNHKESVW